MPYNPDGTFSLVFEFGTGTSQDSIWPNQVGEVNTDVANSLSMADPNDPETIAYFAAGKAQTDFISGIISTPGNQDYRIIEKVPYGMTLTSFAGKMSSGTLTATLKINTTAVTNGVLNATSTQGTVTPTALNVLAANDALVLTISSVSSPVGFSFTVVFTRTLA